MKEKVYSSCKKAIEESEDLILPREYSNRCKKCGKQSLQLYQGYCFEHYLEKIGKK